MAKRYLVYLILAVGTVISGVVLYSNVVIFWFGYSSDNTISKAPTSTFALVFGGGMKSEGIMSEAQADRVLTGVALYQAKKVKKLIMTGDDGAFRKDEVTFMKLLAMSLGVPEADIMIDPHGYRTYESCYRGSVVYGLTEVLVVSQNFHLPRINYLCQRLGIKTAGVSANLQKYGWQGYFGNVREVLARTKAWWQITLTKPLPYSLER